MTEPPRPVEITVPEAGGETLTALVKRALGVSHRDARRAIAERRVTVDGEIDDRPVARPAPGARIAIGAKRSPGAPSGKRPLVGDHFATIHLDRWLVAVDKSPGIVTIPTSARHDEEEDPSLVALLAETMRRAGHRVRDLHVVHRIDRHTSGVVLFARDEKSAEALREQFRARAPQREYLAWVEGRLGRDRQTLTHRLVEPVPGGPVEVTKKKNEGRESICECEVEARGKRSTRVRVRLVTGRRNQIRVQLAAIGFPISGDLLYGAGDGGCGRTALHAARLSVKHPATGETLTVAAPVPDDLLRLDRRLFPPELRIGGGDLS